MYAGRIHDDGRQSGVTNPYDLLILDHDEESVIFRFRDCHPENPGIDSSDLVLDCTLDERKCLEHRLESGWRDSEG